MTVSDITVIIPTLDEELHIARAVSSALDVGAVFVLDSGSSDRTKELAEASGALVFEQAWLGHAKQKNWALDHLPIRSRWVLFLDADETISAELAAEILTVVSARAANAFYIPRTNRFMGRDLKHVWWYPDYQLRLFELGAARYEEREVHEHMISKGTVGHLLAPLQHESLKGVDAFLERHIRYARAEAREIHRARGGAPPLAGLFRPADRRRTIKTRLWYRLRHRPAIRWLWLLVVRRGFLDGRQGRVYAGLIAAYEAMIDAYLLELEQAGNGLQPPSDD